MQCVIYIRSPRDVFFLLINRSKYDLQFICQQTFLHASLFQFLHIITVQTKGTGWQKMKYAMFE